MSISVRIGEAKPAFTPPADLDETKTMDVIISWPCPVPECQGVATTTTDASAYDELICNKGHASSLWKFVQFHSIKSGSGRSGTRVETLPLGTSSWGATIWEVQISKRINERWVPVHASFAEFTKVFDLVQHWTEC